MSPARIAGARRLLALLLAAALLFAVQLGLRHRIVHGPNQAGQTSAASDAAPHSCAAFDAATLAERLTSGIAGAPTCRQRPPTASRRLPLSAALAPTIHFSARAPPPRLPTVTPPAAAMPAPTRLTRTRRLFFGGVSARKKEIE